MNDSGKSRSASNISQIVDLLVENKIKLDALERVFKETNPLVHEFYLGEIETITNERAAEYRRVISAQLTE